jgi:hypothetical protein
VPARLARTDSGLPRIVSTTPFSTEASTTLRKTPVSPRFRTGTAEPGFRFATKPPTVPAVELAFRHRRLLGMIGRFGATRARLGHLATSSDLLELIDARLVTHEPRHAHPLDAWYLTVSGFEALGLTPSAISTRSRTTSSRRTAEANHARRL